LISRYAGTGVEGFSGDGGQALEAEITPGALAVDPSGNLYMADHANNRIRKVTTEGVISTFAGTGVEGFSGDGGPATAATLSTPFGLAADTAGNVYISDSGNGRVRKVSPAGVISTFAGNGRSDDAPSDGIPAIDSSVGAPMGIAVDAVGNMYIADTAFEGVYQVNPAGIISTYFTQDMAGDEWSCVRPMWVAVDGAGHVYISEPGGPVSIVIGVADVSSCYAPGCRYNCSASFGPVAADARGNVYYGYTDDFGGIVGKNGATEPFAGRRHLNFAGEGGQARNATLSSPTAVSFDIVGDMLVADAGNHRVRKVSPNGTITTIAGDGWPRESPAENRPVATDVSLSLVTAITTDKDGNVYLAEDVDQEFLDAVTSTVTKVSPDGKLTVVAGNHGFGFAGDGGPATSAAFSILSGMTRDSAGNLYLADYDYFYGTVRKVSPAGTISTIAGSSTTIGFSGDGGPGRNATLDSPNSLATDAAGNVYIADTGNNRIRKVSTTGTITTFAGTGATGSSGDGGPAVAAALTAPGGLASDALGNLYVSAGGQLRKISPTGIITTVAGTGAGGFSGDGGPATNATFNGPGGIAVDATGNLYVADTDRIRKINTP